MITSAQCFQGMLQKRRQGLDSFFDGLRAPGQRNHQRALQNSRDRSTEPRHRGLVISLLSQELTEPGNQSGTNFGYRFGSHIARPKPGATREEDDGGASL